MSSRAESRWVDPFARLFAPIGLEAFTREYFERAILHVDRQQPRHFSGIYGIGDVEDALQVGATNVAHFSLIRSGSPTLALERYAPPRPGLRGDSGTTAPVPTIDAREVAALVNQGWSLVVNDAALFSARLQRFCNGFQARTGWFVQPNVYLTPPNAQGFDVHYDTHGTIVAQIEGTKRWRLYRPPIELPLESQPSAIASRDALTFDREVLLEPGDTLYLPHGVPHEAVTGETRALHVTFAMRTVRAIDLIERVLASAATTDVALRRSLPADWENDASIVETLRERLQSHLASAFLPASAPRAAERLAIEFYGASRINAEGAFHAASVADRLHSGSSIAIYADRPYAVAPGSGTTLLVAGRALSIPPQCLPALDRLESGPARVDELPGLELAQALWLARALLAYGIAYLVAE